MSVQFDSSRNRWVVRWSEAGRQRTRRFAHEQTARGFDAERREARIAAREAQATGLVGERAPSRALQTIEGQSPADAQATGVYSYATHQGVRWRIAVKQPDGTVTTRRGYRTHAAACRARDLVTHTGAPGAEASFGCFWRRWLVEKQPYLTEGSLEDLATHGRKRLLPYRDEISCHLDDAPARRPRFDNALHPGRKARRLVPRAAFARATPGPSA